MHFFARRRLGLSIAALVLAVDQFSKHFILQNLGSVWVLAPNFLAFNLSFNRGVSFSFLGDVHTPLVLGSLTIPADIWLPLKLSLFALVVVSIFIAWLGSTHRRLFQIGLGLIIGGALGNVVDRLNYGAVVDFIQVHYAAYWVFPTFNVADSAITIGVALILLDGVVDYFSPQHRKTT